MNNHLKMTFSRYKALAAYRVGILITIKINISLILTIKYRTSKGKLGVFLRRFLSGVSRINQAKIEASA
jgi:hypothetical protein